METSKEHGTYSPFERFMYLFLIPIVFTAILISVLLSMFGYNVLEPLQRFANQVPVLNQIVPEPKVDQDQRTSSNGLEESLKEKNIELETELSTLNQKFMEAQSTITDKNAELEEKDALIEKLQQELEEKTLSDEEYLQRIQDLALVYSDMSASKAAPVMEQLTLEERVLVLGQMEKDAQVDILEKMNPVIAAETSIMLKDTVTVRDQEIAALQSRLLIQEGGDESSDVLTNDELSLTIAGMSTENAASLLLEMLKTNESQVLQILRGMDQNARSAIMDELAGRSTDDAARLASQLDG